MKIGFRTWKTAVGVPLAVGIAYFLGLENATSAGILTLLCIQPTLKASIRNAVERLLSALFGLAMACAIFTVADFRLWSIILLFLIFIPVCVKFNIHGGIASSSVIMLHIFAFRQVTGPIVKNELLLILVGIGTALLVNAYMPGMKKKILRIHTTIQHTMADILKELAAYIRDGRADWDGKEMLVLAEALKEASALAVMDSENRLRREHHPFLVYCESKKQQYELLERMLTAASRMDTGLEQGRRIGNFMLELAERVRAGEEIHTQAEKLRGIREYHKTLPMPTNRAEFENRAALFTLVNELELFLQKDQTFHGFA